MGICDFKNYLDELLNCRKISTKKCDIMNNIYVILDIEILYVLFKPTIDIKPALVIRGHALRSFDNSRSGKQGKTAINEGLFMT